MSQYKALTPTDINHLKRCLDLAAKAVSAGDKPFGSILVNSDDQVIAQARNRVNERTPLAHPEYELALWAAENLSVEERKKTVMYTTGEDCAMCAAAHGWAGLGTIVYLSSSKQLQQWLHEMDVPAAPIYFYPVEKVIKDIEVRGPASGELLDKIKELHREYYKNHSA